MTAAEWIDRKVTAEMDGSADVRVVALLPAVPAPDHHSRPIPARAEVALCTASGRIIRTLAGKETRTKIRLDRFRPTSNGYRLIQDAPEEDA